MSYDFGGTYFEDAQLVSTYKQPSLDLLERIHVTQDKFRSETDCDYSIEVSSINKSNCKITKLKSSIDYSLSSTKSISEMIISLLNPVSLPINISEFSNTADSFSSFIISRLSLRVSGDTIVSFTS